MDAHDERVVQRLVEIEASLTLLADEDLLDLVNMLKAEPHAPLGEMVFA